MAHLLPDPKANRPHRSVGGQLADGAQVAISGTGAVNVPLAGAIRLRIRFKCDRAGTLRLNFLRPDGVTVYSTSQPTDVVVSANTETKLDVDPHFGEGEATLSFINGAVGTATIAYCDISQT